MRPLQSIAMGLVIISLNVAINGYDLIANPLGWLLVINGVRGLPEDLEHKDGLLMVAVLAGVVSVPLWFPDFSTALDDIHPSLLWAANLPQIGFVALLAHALARRATEYGEASAAASLRVLLTAFVLSAVLPVLILGADLTWLAVLTVLGTLLAMVTLICLLFSWSARPWVGADRPTGAIAPE